MKNSTGDQKHAHNGTDLYLKKLKHIRIIYTYFRKICSHSADKRLIYNSYFANFMSSLHLLQRMRANCLFLGFRSCCATLLSILISALLMNYIIFHYLIILSLKERCL